MFFPPSNSKVIKDHLRKYAGRNAPSYKGNNRRALSLLPQPMIGSDVLVKGAVINVRSNVLLSLEANQKSGCLIVRSEKNKSRAGILMYRGRILGCMRGKKGTRDYAFGNQAYERTLEDLANTGKTDIYGLKDEVVAAAGALFHGEMHEHSTKPAKKSFEEEFNNLVKSKLPGCIVITDKPATATCIVYVFSGQIVGIYSRKEGWLKPKIDVVRKFISSCKNPRVQSCSMPSPETDAFKQYSFSLSGLADRDFDRTQQASPLHERGTRL